MVDGVEESGELQLQLLDSVLFAIILA